MKPNAAIASPHSPAATHTQVERVRAGKPDHRDQEPRERGPAHAGQIEDDVLDRDRRGEELARHEARNERVPRGPLERVRGRAEDLGHEEEGNARARQERVDEQTHGDEQQSNVGSKEQQPPVDGIGDRARVEGHGQQREDRGEAEQPDDRRGVGEGVDLKRDRDRGDLTPDRGDARAEPEPPEVAALAERPDVDGDAREKRAAGPRAFAGVLAHPPTLDVQR